MINMKISKIGERKLIQRLLKKRDETLGNIDNTILKSYHDDAAIEENTSKYTVLSTDMLIQHSHFPKQMTYFQMGEKIVTVNVSDILAMNATPVSILIAMALPSTLTIDEFDEIIDGILYKCKEYGVTLIGGDLNQSDEIILSATTTGKINKNIKLQSNIQEDNLVAITGQLGMPAAALDLLSKYEIKYLSNEYEEIIKSILEPNLPIKTAKFLREHPTLITSMTDITDGLAIELGHLHEKNTNIGFEIYADKLPYNKHISQIATENNKSLNEYLLHFGEEFELLLTLDKKEYLKYKDKLNNIHIIGKVNNSDKITLISQKSVKTMKITGYEHLKEN